MTQQKRFGTCSMDCYGACVFQGVWNDEALEEKLQKVIPLKEHPFTLGFCCDKYVNRIKFLYHPQRVKSFLTRSGTKGENTFIPIESNNAYALVQKKLFDTISVAGSKNIFGISYSINSGLIANTAPLRFFNFLGASLTSGGICNEGGIAGLKTLFGTYSTTNPFQITNPATKLIVVWGSNLSETNVHAYNLVKKARKQGAYLIVVDSRQTNIAKEADLFLHIMPNSDSLVVNLLLQDLIQKKALDNKFIEDHVEGYQTVQKEVLQYKKSQLFAISQIDPGLLSKFVNELIKNQHHTIFMIGFGVQKDLYGGRLVRSIALLQIFLGNIGKPGTGIIYSQSAFNHPFYIPIGNQLAKPNIITTRKISQEVPLLTLGSKLKKLNENNKSPILLFIWNIDAATALPFQRQLRDDLSNPNVFVVYLTTFLNETTKYADIVIPLKFDVETNDLISGYYVPGISRINAGPCPYPECLTPYDFFRQLILKIPSDVLQTTSSELSDWFPQESILFNESFQLLPKNMREDLDRQGYSLLFNSDDIPFSDLQFPTVSKKIIVNSLSIKLPVDILTERTNRKPHQYLLLTPSHKLCLHSQLIQVNESIHDDFNKIYLNSKDIEFEKLQIGNEMLISNEYGEGIYLLEKMDELKHGCALIYSGPSSQLYNHPNANFFTPETPEELGQSGSYNSALIFIRSIKDK